MRPSVPAIVHIPKGVRPLSSKTWRHPRADSRVFTPRKALCFAHYRNLLDSSSLVLLLHHSNFSANQLSKLRRDLLKADSRNRPPTAPVGRASLHVVRPAILSAVIRTHRPQWQTPDLNATAKGPVAALVHPFLDPPMLTALLRVVDRAVPRRLAPPEPGERPRPQLSIIGGFLDGSVMNEERVRETAKLPSLDTLRAQIVGLLSGTAAQLGGLLDAARGGRAVSMLESYKKGLEEGTPKEGE